MTAPLGGLEAALASQGFRYVAGTDEAGRGALAGPLVAAAVVLPHGWVPEGLRDSKLLTARQRSRLYDEIRANAVAVAVKRVTPERLDVVGLQRANLSALRESVAKLDVTPDYVLVDGFSLRLDTPSLRVVKGDMVCASVAAASVIAKVTRDRHMIRMAKRYPGYGFERHKGYAAAEHVDSLERLGPTPIHRHCFVRVAQLRLFAAASVSVPRDEVDEWE